jgi:tetratricopeptide (TPR) repeat protein
MQSPPAPNPHSYARWIALIIAAFYFLPALGIISKTAFWAFSVNTYFQSGLTVAHLILVMIAFAMMFKPTLFSFAERISATSYYVFFACTMILMALFLREAVPFYGDGYYFQRDISTGMPVKYAEVLSILIYKAVYIVMPGGLKTGATVYRVVNTACVIPAVFLLSRLAGRVKQDYRPFVFLTFLAFGSNVLFFGHIENYTLCLVSMLAYLYLITKPEPRISILAFLLGLSLCLHLIAVCLIPSFIYVCWKNQPRKLSSLLTWVGAFLAPFVVTILLSYTAGMTPARMCSEIMDSATTLPQHTGKDFFSAIFSIHHGLAIVNLLFLGLPIFPVIASLVFGRRKNSYLWRDEETRVLLYTGVPFVLFILLFNSPLGLARDWDLGVTALVWRVLAIIYLGAKVAPRLRIKPQFLTSIGLLGFFLSLPWLAIHRFPERSMKRYEDLLDGSPELLGAAYGYEILARHYHDMRDYGNSAKYYEKAAEYDPQNWRHYYNSAMEYLNMADHQSGLRDLRKAYEINPNEPTVLTKLGTAYRNIGAHDSALLVLKQAYKLDSNEIATRHNLGCAYYWVGQYDSAYYVFTRILNEYPDQYNAMFGLIDVMLAVGKAQEAERLVRRMESRYGRDEIVRKYLKAIASLKQEKK